MAQESTGSKKVLLMIGLGATHRGVFETVRRGAACCDSKWRADSNPAQAGRRSFGQTRYKLC